MRRRSFWLRSDDCLRSREYELRAHKRVGKSLMLAFRKLIGELGRVRHCVVKDYDDHFSLDLQWAKMEGHSGT
jgi:hypothetical protein